MNGTTYDTMAVEVNDNRKKRIRTTISRLRRKNRRIRATAVKYKRWAMAAGGLAVVATAILGFITVQETQPDPVLLGRGTAGVYADSLQAASEDEEGGSDAGSGEASYYGNELAGRPTASGETFDPQGMTAAHRTLPLGSRVRVTNLRTGQSVVVRINDRGPFAQHRVIDLSEGAARQIGMLGAGTATVRLHLLD